MVQRGQRTLQITSIILLVLLAVTGLTYRFQMDDLYYSARVSLTPPYPKLAALDFMRDIYLTWNGRYSTILFQTIVGAFEPVTSMLLPGLTIAGLTLLLRANLKASRYARLAWLAPVWIVCWMIALPARDFSIFWVSAIASQYVPLLFVGLTCLLMLKGRAPLWLLPLGLITGGFAEITTLTLMWLPLLVYRRWQIVYWWMGMGIALVVLLTAPGVAVRLSYAEVQDWSVVLQRVGTEWVLSPERLAMLPGLALAFLTGYLYPEKTRQNTVVVVWASTLLVTLSTAILVTRGGGGVSGWVMALPTGTLVIASWLTGSYVSGWRWQRLARVGIVSLWAGVYLASAVLLVDRLWSVSQWEARDRAIRSGQTVVRVIDGRDSFFPPQEIYIASLEAWYGTPLTLDVPDWMEMYMDAKRTIQR